MAIWYFAGAPKEHVGDGEEFTGPDGLRYSATWPKADIPGGVLVKTVGEHGDPALYVNTTDCSGATRTLTKTAKPLADCKAVLIRRVKQTAESLLSPTDYKSLRAWERGEQLDPALRAWRETVRFTSNLAEDRINACATVDELEALPPAIWPEFV